MVPRAADAQNNTCQSAFSARNAAAGKPSAPPTPSDALIKAIDEPSRSLGNSSRMMLMPSAITPDDNPCSARPTIIGNRLSASAPITEPATNAITLSSSIRRFPYMSPSRPIVGVATAAANRVAVIAHAASDAEACNRCGSSGMSGITKLCISDTTMPANASTATTTFGRRAGDVSASATVVGACDMYGTPEWFDPDSRFKSVD